MTRRPWLGLATLALLAGAVCATGLPGAATARLDSATAVAGGGALGMVLAGLVTAFSSGSPERWRPAPRRAPTGAGIGLVLVGAAACEEVVWRGGVQAGAWTLIGPVGALAAASLLFGAAHGPLRRRMATHVATGAAFGIAFLASGRLIAAVAAHGAYNLTLLAAERGAVA